MPVYTLFILACIILPYLIGSIPFGLILTRAAGLGDVRKIGSGNIGATNVLRTGRKDLAIATLLCDAAKGALVIIAYRYFIEHKVMPQMDYYMGITFGGTPAQKELVQWLPYVPLLAGGMVIIGHMFSIWLRFKGGKGVATSLGVITAVSWPVGVAAFGTWLLVAFVSRYSSLSAMAAAAAAPIYAWYFTDHVTALAFLGIALLVITRHYKNIRNLLQGAEAKIKLKNSV